MNLALNFLLTIGMLSIGLIVGILIKQRNRGLHKSLLIVIFSLLFFVVLHSYGELNKVDAIFNVTFVIADTIGFLLGPLLYIYIQSIYKKKEAVIPNGLWHFIPSLLYFAFVSFPFLLSYIKDGYVFSYLLFIDKNSLILQIQVLYLLIYVILSIRLLRKYKLLSKMNFSNFNSTDLKWVHYLLYGIVFIVLVNIAVEIYSSIYQSQLILDNTLTTLALILVIVYLGYYGISQSQILLPNHLYEAQEPTLTSESNGTSHHLANASQDEIENLKKQLEILLETRKPYLDENLSLKKLAEMIPTTDRRLSALLNHYYHISFYDFINSYRVKEVKQKMAQKEYNKYTILGLAFNAGFNSKSSFNRVFKKETGISPSEFKNWLQKDSE